MAAAFAFFAVAHTATWHIVVAMTLMGFGIGVAYAVMPILIIERTPPARTASATGINQVLRLMGGAVGAAAVAAVLAAHVPAGRLNPDESGYVAASIVAVALGLVAAVVAYVMVPANDADRDLEPGPNPSAVSPVT
jgi:MFS family permease